MSIANARLNGLPGAAAAGRFAALVSLPNILLAGCVVIAVWFVFVPLSALIYNAFTEDTGFGPGASVRSTTQATSAPMTKVVSAVPTAKTNEFQNSRRMCQLE